MQSKVFAAFLFLSHFLSNVLLAFHVRDAYSIRCTSLSSSIRTDVLHNTLSIENILVMVNQTEAGINASPAIAKTVDSWIQMKAKEYEDMHTPSTTLEDPKLIGNYEVVFVGMNPSMQREGNPAGGGYRSALGRSIFKNKGLYQHIIPSVVGPQSTGTGLTVINYITGRLFGLFTLSVILRGTVEALPEEERTALMSQFGSILTTSTVKARFEPPLLGLGHCWQGGQERLLVTACLGQPSSVVLDTPYVCEKVRLGRGSRGSTFIFQRTSDPAADGYKAVLEHRPLNICNLRKVLLLALGLGFAPFAVRIMAPVLSAFLPRLRQTVAVVAASLIRFATDCKK